MPQSNPNRQAMPPIRPKSALRTLTETRGGGRLSLAVICVFWGSTFTLTKQALRHEGVFAFLTLRFTLALLCVIGGTMIFRTLRRRPRWTGFAPSRIGVVLGLMLFGTFWAQTFGLTLLSPSTSGFITGSAVVMVPLLARATGVRLHRGQSVGAVGALVGLLVLSWPLRLSNLTGEAVTLACAFLVAAQIVVTEREIGESNLLSIVTTQLGVVAVLSGVLSLVVDTRPPEVSYALSAITSEPVVVAVVVGAVFATAIAYVAQTHFQRILSSTEVGVIFNLEPLFASVFAEIVLPHPITAEFLLGGAVIIGSMMAASLT